MAVSEAALAKFIRDNIHTVWSLELLLVLHADATRFWSAAELVKELRASTTLVQRSLLHFSSRGIVVEAAQGWGLAPTPWQNELLEQLALTYRQRPIATVSLIRGADPVQALADAFRIKGGKDE